jgi:hypothetical protein
MSDPQQEQRHTPGPWTLFHKGSTIQISDKRGPKDGHKSGNAVVFWTGFDASDKPLAEKIANARLIAAAPDLWKAIQFFIDAEDTGLEDHELNKFSDLARAAARKAKGA